MTVPERSPNGVAPLLEVDAAKAIPGQYIVVLKDGALGDNLSAQTEDSLIQAFGLQAQGVTVQQVYGFVLDGFAAKLSAENLETLRSDPRVKYVEQDQVVELNATQNGATWGLDRVDQRNLPLNSTYVYDQTAANVVSYVIDTGIRTTHTDFGGRATFGTNTTGDGQNTDCNGHGTHVAGTVGGTQYGLAKATRLVAVKVLACNGSGSNSGVVAGINWAAQNRQSRPAVANMSLGGGASQATDDAVTNAVTSGLVMVVAAGNENQNACNVSPARAPRAITVASTTNTDARSSFSNWGSCVDIHAPGSSITSAWHTSDTNTNTISGTSMASPHVAGGAALILAANPGFTPAQVESALKTNATLNKVTDAKGSPNLLLFTNPGGGTTPTPTPEPTPPTYDRTYQGTLYSGQNQVTQYYQYAGGTITGELKFPASADFDLYLQKWNGSSWAYVAQANGVANPERVSYNATSGYYRWIVNAYSGSGSFVLGENN
ncbi:S8 family peptidase [Deinococcus radiophilus]|uniref:S8 family peptidase n=1 Tax=Deinococcus radiophilus TaxID=32062 RepID=UPI00361D552B